MNNLTTREKAMAFGILLILIIFLVYFFGIRILNDKYDEYKKKLTDLQARKAFLDELKEENAKMEKEIETLEANIEKIELSFIDKLETEVIEQYMLAIFEKNECPFLNKVTVSDVPMNPITLPDGTTSDNSVLCRSVEVAYVTGDGFLPTTYNATPLFRDPDTMMPSDVIPKDLIKQVDRQSVLRRKIVGSLEGEAALNDEEKALLIKNFQGYEGFLKSLKQIADDNKDCIKVTDIKAESKSGFMTLTATVNFYSANLASRVSTDTSKEAYTYWSGHTNIDTKGGFIGMPYIVLNKDSLWDHVSIISGQVGGFIDRPYTPWVVNAYFTKRIDKDTLAYVTGVADTSVNDPNANGTDADDMTQTSN